VGQHRSIQRHSVKVVSIEEGKLRHRLREIAAEHIRWGRRVAYRLLRREGLGVNHMRVQRLWREEGLQRPISRKRKRARPADGSVRRHRAEHPYQVWIMDFHFDATADGRRLKFLNVIDGHSRLCLAMRVGSRCKAKDVVGVLEELTSLKPAPAFIRSGNRPEFIAQALRDWCEASTTTSTAYIAPGGPPCENGFAESFNAVSWMSSSTSSCSPPLRRHRSWLIASAGIQLTEAALGSPGAYAPGEPLNKGLPHDHIHRPS